jgi:hypothetical protein
VKCEEYELMVAAFRLFLSPSAFFFDVFGIHKQLRKAHTDLPEVQLRGDADPPRCCES